MSDLIDRQAAIDALNEVTYWERSGMFVKMDVFNAIGKVPSAPPTSRREWYQKGYKDGQAEQPMRKKGKWVEHNTTSYLVCDQCRDVYILQEWLADGKWNFCPNCGVDMRGEQK